MPERERAIGNRLRHFRSLMGLSQAEFSQVIGVDPRAYASYEYSRSQLNYPVAWRLLNAFRFLNPIWLADGRGSMVQICFISYPAPESISFGPRAPFSAVFDELLRPLLLSSRSALLKNPDEPFPLFRVEPGVSGRLACKDILTEMVNQWVAAQPDSQLNGFANDLVRCGGELLRKYLPEQDPDTITKRHVELARADAKRKIASSSGVGKELGLTESLAVVKHALVKSEMANLLDRLKLATANRGKKSELASFLDVSLAQISQWLSGERKPNGETTLKLLKWVQEQERE